VYSGDTKGNLGLKSIRAGSYELSWFDCATGRWVIQPHVTVKGGSGAWAKPSGLGDEVALYVRRKVSD